MNTDKIIEPGLVQELKGHYFENLLVSWGSLSIDIMEFLLHMSSFCVNTRRLVNRRDFRKEHQTQLKDWKQEL